MAEQGTARMIGKRIDVFGEGYRGNENRRGKYLCVGLEAPAIGNGGSVDGNAIKGKDNIVSRSGVSIDTRAGPLQSRVGTEAVSVEDVCRCDLRGYYGIL